MHVLNSFQGATETQLTGDESQSFKISPHELNSNVLIRT